jgi:superoxide dismutase, Cu-Zn family
MRTALIIAAGLAAGIASVATVTATDGRKTTARTTLRLADGTNVGTVRFRDRDDTTQVQVQLRVPATAMAVRAFHGLHIHANDNPANGKGCRADPGAAPSTWFVSADGHLKQDGQVHAGHDGDMPPLHLDANGRARATFTIDRFDVGDLDGRVVIVHAGPDNLGNVPVGTDPTQYTPNSPAALERTHATGNAGDRIACGEISLP